jgi:hypothetical protein
MSLALLERGPLQVSQVKFLMASSCQRRSDRGVYGRRLVADLLVNWHSLPLNRQAARAARCAFVGNRYRPREKRDAFVTVSVTLVGACEHEGSSH